MQLVDGDRLVERDLRAEADVAADGRVLDAAYLEERGLFERIFGVFSGKAASAALSLVPPFDIAGSDVHGLFAASSEVPPLEPHGAALGQVRRARGRVVPLGPKVPPDGAVLRALWLDHPPALHACEAIEFAVVPDEGPTVVLSFDLSPLIVDRPSRVTMAGFLSRVGPRMRALLRAMHVRRSRQEEGLFVEISSGQTVEVLCVVRAEVQGGREFSIGGEMRTLPMEARPSEGGPYRGTSNVQTILAGDAPGIRAVVRRIG